MNEKTESASAKIVPPINFFRQKFRYDPESGKVYWRATKTKCEREFGNLFKQTTNGKVCGLKSSISFGGKTLNVPAHRLAWMLTHGDIPAGMSIDHIDGDPTNNRISNLRLATHSQNLANSCNYRCQSRALPRGVYKKKNERRYYSMASKDGQKIHLGYYDTPELAHQAFLKKSREIHGEFFKLYKESGETGGLFPASP